MPGVSRLHLDRWSLGLVGAAVADLSTFVLMGVEHEANPIVAGHPVAAIAAKAVLAGLLVLWRGKYAAPVRAFGVLAWGFGTLTNVQVLLGG